MKFPFEGRPHPSPVKAFEPTIVFVHNFGGSHVSTKRHQEMVSTMGFDSFSFNLSLCSIPLTRSQKLEALAVGMFERWTRELETILNLLEGPKILYTFSFPSATVPALLYRARRSDILGWVCDGGPFMNLWQNLWNFYTYQRPVKNKLIRLAKTESSHVVFGGLTYHARLRKWIPALDTRLPILSVREGADQLVAEEAIDRLFALNLGLNLTKLVIPGAGHLDGLRKNPELYKLHVGNFLRGLAERQT